jgi:hypothetical protein
MPRNQKPATPSVLALRAYHAEVEAAWAAFDAETADAAAVYHAIAHAAFDARKAAERAALALHDVRDPACDALFRAARTAEHEAIREPGRVFDRAARAPKARRIARIAAAWAAVEEARAAARRAR